MREREQENYLCICLGGSGSELITYNLMANLRQYEVLDDFDEVVVINGLSPEKQDQLALGSNLQSFHNHPIIWNSSMTHGLPSPAPVSPPWSAFTSIIVA